MVMAWAIIVALFVALGRFLYAVESFVVQTREQCEAIAEDVVTMQRVLSSLGNRVNLLEEAFLIARRRESSAVGRSESSEGRRGGEETSSRRRKVGMHWREHRHFQSCESL